MPKEIKEYTIRELIFECLESIIKIHNHYHQFKKSCDCQNIMHQLNVLADLFDFRVAKEVFKK